MAKDPHARLRKRLASVGAGEGYERSNFRAFIDNDDTGPAALVASAVVVVGAFATGLIAAAGEAPTWPLLLVPPLGAGMWGWFKAWQHSRRKRVTVTQEVRHDLDQLLSVIERLKALESKEARQLEVTVLEVAESMVSVGRTLHAAGPHDAERVAAQHAELGTVTKEFSAAAKALEDACAHEHHELVVKAELAAGDDAVSTMRRTSASARADSEAVRDVRAAALEEVLSISAHPQVEVRPSAALTRTVLTN